MAGEGLHVDEAGRMCGGVLWRERGRLGFFGGRLKGHLAAPLFHDGQSVSSMTNTCPSVSH